MSEYHEQDEGEQIYSGGLCAMSRSDQGKRTAHITVWATTGWLALCLIVGAVFYSEGAKTERYRQQPYAYAVSAKQNAKNTCVGVNPAAVFECVFDEVERSREDARAEQDIDAQQAMAVWALTMVIVSAVTTIVTGIGVWFVKRTLDATLVAVDETGKATLAMDRQINLAEKAHALENRAWLFFDSWDVIPKRDGPNGQPIMLSIQTRFRNSGKTPAFNTRIFVEIYQASPQGNPVPNFPIPDLNDGKSIVGPGVTIHGYELTLSGVDMTNFLNDATDFFVFCNCVYSDTFAKDYGSRTLQMCFKVKFRGIKVDPSGSEIYDCAFEPTGPQNCFT